MPTTCRDIVRIALRKLSRVAAGMEPSGNDLDDGVETLQSIYSELVNLGVFGRFYDVVVTDATYTAYPQQRVNCNRVGGVDVTLPQFIDPSTYPTDWWALGCGYYDYQFRDYYCGSGPMPPHDGACIQINDQFSATEETWIYNSLGGRWLELDNLNAGDGAPLGGRYRDGLASLVASRIASEYGMTVPPQVASAAQTFLYSLSHRYSSASSAPASAEYF